MGKSTTFPAVTQPLQQDFQEIMQISFWSLVDCGATQFGSSLQQFIDDYNKQCPTTTVTDKLGRTRTCRKGLIRGNQTLVVRELIHTCFQQMEELRLSNNAEDQQRYYDYVTAAYIDGLPVIMNRGWIRSKIKKAACKSSIWNYLNQLQSAKIILTKQNTSRVRQEIVDELGHKTIVVDMNSNGRGDFILWLDVRLFAWKLRIRQSTGLESNQIQNIEQYTYDLTKTLKKEDNNCSKGVPIGTTVNLSPDAIASVTYKPNENGKMQSSAAAPRPVAPADKEKLQKEAKIKHLRQETHIDEQLPKKESVFWVTMLYHQLLLLYPRLDRNYLSKVEKQIKELLYLHMVRLDLPAKDAFAKVSRGIELAQLWLSANPERYVYEPLTYLRLDEEYTTGTFRTVMDGWVAAEAKRLKVVNTKNQNLVKWQKAHAKMEQLFKNVMYSLHLHGYAHAKKTFGEADRQLAMYFGKLHLADETRAKVRRSFTDRCTNIFKTLRDQAAERPDQDQLNQTFQAWLNSKTG